MTESISLPVVAGAVGAAVDTSSLNAKKTLILSGVSGSVTVEVSGDGVEFCPLKSFTSNNDSVEVVAAAFMRVDATAGAATSAEAMAERGNIRTGMVPMPPSSGPGASLDISDFGCLTTVAVSQLTDGGSVGIEISADDVNWSPDFKTFTADGCDTKSISARFIRAVGQGGSANIFVSSEDPPVWDVNVGPNNLIMSEGTDLSDKPANWFNDWTKLAETLDRTKDDGYRNLYVRTVDAPGGVTTVPALAGGAKYEMRDVHMILAEPTKPKNAAIDAPDMIVLGEFNELLRISSEGEIGIIEHQGTGGSPLIPNLGATMHITRIYLKQGAAATSNMMSIPANAGPPIPVLLRMETSRILVDPGATLDTIFLSAAPALFIPILGASSAFAPGNGSAGTLGGVPGSIVGGALVGQIRTENRFDAAAQPNLASSFGQWVIVGENPWNFRSVTDADSPVTAQLMDSIEADATGAVVVIDLPPASRNWGRVIRAQAVVAGNSVDVTPDGTDTVNGGAPGAAYSLSGTAGEFVEVVSDGVSNWRIVGHGVP